MGKKVKFETKRLGYFILGNTLVWLNLLVGFYLQKGDTAKVVEILKYLSALGVVLLLGRKLIADVIVRLFGKVVVKK